ncbi:phage terminase, large subunit, PBSX family [Oscillibacter sp. PC13]|uniref:PBSX family phage terminase large subunit n=1 Tax=Oscillibacter sp. PC13 TaxID=1855299 RepID=UPI0008E22176|nr:PBSX family phage terminase large subunit [Oscillibacter sp. PC13]SFP19042.1 phage terminase, large subunit, PBSX family [Oscillibacter sp. PC13]
MQFSKKQKRVLTWWCQGGAYDALICDGAVRSGKTFSMGVSFFLWAMTCFDGKQFGLCGKTILSLRRNLLTDLMPYLRRLGMHCQEKRSENLLTVRLNDHENQFLLFGGRDESSAALIQGSTLAGVLLDEAALMPRSFVEQACARCSVAGSRLWFNCNPEGPQHWFYQEWIQKAKQRRALYLHFTMEDNPALTPRIRARYRSAYSGVFFRRFVLGEWVAAQGLVYDFFDRKQNAVPVPDGAFSEWRVSIDYGTANPASFGIWGKKDAVWYRVQEYYYDSRREGRQKTDAEYAEDLKRLLNGRIVTRVIVDPSAASFIETLRRENFPVIRADNSVSDGIRVTANLLKNGQMVICEGCTDCLREIELYCWDAQGEKDAPKKEHDHAMDDMRYFAMDLAGRTARGFAATWVERGGF